MRFYKITGMPVGFAAGAVLCLSAAQFSARSHRVDVMQRLDAAGLPAAADPPDNDFYPTAFVVRTRETMKFKVGEIIGVAEDPDKSQVDYLVPAGLTAPMAASAANSKPVVRAPPKEKFREDGSRRISRPNAVVGQKPKGAKTPAAAPPAPAGGQDGTPASDVASTGEAAPAAPAVAGTGDGVTGDA